MIRNSFVRCNGCGLLIKIPLDTLPYDPMWLALAGEPIYCEACIQQKEREDQIYDAWYESLVNNGLLDFINDDPDQPIE